MPITIKGIRLESVTLERTDATGELDIKTASYSLMSSLDRVLANQSIGGYSDKVKVSPSARTVGLLREFLDCYKKDVIATLGLEEA